MGSPDVRRALGSEIKRLVDSSPLLKKQVARSLGVSPALLSNWFAGRATPSLEQVDAVAGFARTNGHNDEVLRDLWSRARHSDADGDSAESDFVEFFGLDAAEYGITLVYPEFDLHEGRLMPRNGAEIHADLAKFPTEVAGDRLTGFGPVVSAHDLGAVAVLADLFSEHKLRSRLAVDSAVIRQGAQQPLVSIGLRSNNVTTFYLRGDDAIFRVAVGERNRVEMPNGEEFESTPPMWRGIVARVTPRPREAPNRRWFFCAGLGGIGTSVAAHYLARYWRNLHDDVGEADFVAVVVGHELTPATATRERLFLADSVS